MTSTSTTLTTQSGRGIITLDELSEHSTLASLWIAVHGQVYDLTTFTADHPGGIEVLRDCGGLDGTEAYEYAGHGASSAAKLQQFCVGKLADASVTNNALSQTQNGPSGAESRRRRASGGAKKQATFIPRWAKVAAVATLVSLFAALLFLRAGSGFGGRVSSVLDFFGAEEEEGSRRNDLSMSLVGGGGFWAGAAIASSAGCVGFGYLYRVFLSTLDYQNEVFSFPATIPRRK